MKQFYLAIFIILASAVQSFAAISKDSDKWTKTTISKNQTIEFDAKSPDTIELSGTITINSGYTLTILNKSGKTITITKTVKNDMFTNNGSLVIIGSDNNRIVLDGGADYSFSKSDYSLTSSNSITGRCINSKGHLDLQYVTIQNCNNYSADGGAIYLSTSKQTELNHCLIQNCTAWRGSAIIINANNADPDLSAVIINNSTITQCVTGGASNSTQNNCGGAIRTFAGVSSNLYLTSVTMTWNYSRREIDEFTSTPHELYHDGNGGALFWNGRKQEGTTCYIDGCTFEYNKCDDNGGAIKAQGSIKFYNNTTKISNNTAPLGAGLYIEGYTGSVSTGISSITYDLNEFLEITNNTAVSYTDHNGATAPGKGAGIYFDFGQLMTLKEKSTITVDLNGAKINNNKSNDSNGLGGGIYYEENSKPEKKYQFNIYLNHGEVNNNSASVNGGGIYVSKGDVTYSKVEIGKSLTVKMNSAANGAGIFIKDGSLEMAHGTISQNSITGTGNGGGIFIENGDFTINAGKISGNSVGNGNGGGVYIVGSGDLGNFVMNGGSITGNSVTGTEEHTGFGGGIYVNGGNFTMTEEAARGMISSNAATRDGGGVYISGGKFQQDNGSISSNVSEADGGGVCIVNGGSFTMAGGSITANGKQNSTIKTENGGGVYLNGGNFVLENGTISGNGAIENGGGVFLTGENCRYELKNGDITGNSAGNGGGVYLEKGLFILGNTVNLQDGNISSNAATFGGGVYIGSADNGSVTAADDAQDTEPTEGFIMRGGTITSNTTVNDGGGIYLNGGSFLMNNGDIVGNSSSTDGGGVCIANNGNFTMNNGKITGNGKKGSDVVTVNGGGVYLDGGRLIVSAGNISHNAATASGGGVYISNGSVEMGDGEVQSNTCGAYGGGIYVYNDPQSSQPKNVEVSGGNLLKNTAVYGGGICVDGPINLDIGNVEIAENKATNGGGVCLMNSANMTFGAGQIKNNIANKSEGSGTYQKTTANQKDITEVEGMGGGIYLNSNTRLVFNETDELGLFGNKADNGADEIFANGKDTFVNLPNVTGMALDGYPGAGNLKWLEDYITDDTEYDEGTFIRNTDKYSPGAWATDGKNMRYRDAISQNERNWIFELEGEANAENGLGYRYICFALGYEIIYVTITRSGLAAGESAIYKLAKTDGGTSFSIIITGDGSDSISKKVAVTAGTWSITETDWSYAYDLTITDENVQDDGKTITKDISDEEDRQFIFAGSRKGADALPLNFEDVVMNVAGN